MGWANFAVYLVAIIQILSPFLQSRVAAENFLAPLLSPVINNICDPVECGKGNCSVSLNHTFGFVCECKPGWTQFHVEDHLRFLPCVVPNCTLNYSCNQNAKPAAPPPFSSPPSNLSIFDPCLWSYCGDGTCVKKTTFEHRCDCKEGFSNLLNVTSFPCYRDCALGADCANLGITLSNGSSTASPPNLSDNGSNKASSTPTGLLWLFVLTIPLAMVRAN